MFPGTKEDPIFRKGVWAVVGLSTSRTMGWEWGDLGSRTTWLQLQSHAPSLGLGLDFSDTIGSNTGICGQAQLWIPRAARGLGAGGERILEACLGEGLPGRLHPPLLGAPLLSPRLFQAPAPPLSSPYCVSCHLKASDYPLLSAAKSRAFQLQQRHRPHEPQLLVYLPYHLGVPGPGLRKFFLRAGSLSPKNLSVPLICLEGRREESVPISGVSHSGRGKERGDPGPGLNHNLSLREMKGQSAVEGGRRDVSTRLGVTPNQGLRGVEGGLDTQLFPDH